MREDNYTMIRQWGKRYTGVYVINLTFQPLMYDWFLTTKREYFGCDNASKAAFKLTSVCMVLDCEYSLGGVVPAIPVPAMPVPAMPAWNMLD